MKKQGFTLSELLIALGIAGVISALTIPTLVTSMQNRANASRLASSVSAIENAFTTMIVREGANNIFETQAFGVHGGNKPQFASSISEHLTLLGFQVLENDTKGYYGEGRGPFALTADGSKSADVNDDIAKLLVSTEGKLLGGNHVLNLKNGATLFLIINNQLPPNNENRIRDNGGGLFVKAADIWIDVNGTDLPNTMGRDIFGFYLGENGKLYPCGGRDVSTLDNWGGVWNDPQAHRRCLNRDIGDNGLGCTARVVEEGYKINY